MNATNKNSTTDSLASAPPTASRARGRRWLIGLGLLALAVILWGGWKLTRPAPDLSSSITVETSPIDERLPSMEPEQAEGSLLSKLDAKTFEAAEHPFDPLLRVAAAALKNIDENVADYTGEITSQVQLNGKLQPEQKNACKIRHARTTGDNQCGFSVYLRFEEPADTAGQEVIWVDGWNNGNLVAHATGWQNLMRFYLEPESILAMRNSRHSIKDIGFRNLLAKMLEKGARDREYDECEVKVERNLKIGGRQCVKLEVRHPVEREYFEYHIARIYLDQELEIPIGYEGFLWPEEEGGDPPLVEKYFYTNLKLNVGLQDADFDPSNEAYNYPAE